MRRFTVELEETDDERPPYRMEQYRSGIIKVKWAHNNGIGETWCDPKLRNSGRNLILSVLRDWYGEVKDVDEPRAWYEVYLKTLTHIEAGTWRYAIAQEYLD